MEKTITEKSVHRKWIVPVLAVFLLMAVLIIWHSKKQETEYSIIQAIIEELPDYQYELESWGYRVSVLPKMKLPFFLKVPEAALKWSDFSPCSLVQLWNVSSTG